MATVETRGIKKKFGDIVAVNGVSLLTRDGEFLVLLGPSGCGKSKSYERFAAAGAENRHGFSKLRALSAHDRV